MAAQRSTRNKTLTLTPLEKTEFLSRTVTLSSSPTVEEILDTTILGDALKSLTFLPPSFVDLLIVDPPYNLSKNYHGKIFQSRSSSEYENFTRAWIEGCLPLLKPTASVYVCCDWKSSLIIGRILSDYFTIQNRITWQREKGRGAKSNWKNSMEDIWFATVSNHNFIFNVDSVLMRRKVIAPYKVNGQPKDWEETSSGNFRNTHPSNFWDDITIPFWSMPENTEHPAQKPEKLIAKLILASSNDGDVVLDPFLGSGTTSVTAKKLGRRYIGIEENSLYCAWAEKRLQLADEDSSIQGYAGGVFWERNSLAAQQQEVTKTRKIRDKKTNLEGLF